MMYQEEERLLNQTDGYGNPDSTTHWLFAHQANHFPELGSHLKNDQDSALLLRE